VPEASGQLGIMRLMRRWPVWEEVDGPAWDRPALDLGLSVIRGDGAALPADEWLGWRPAVAAAVAVVHFVDSGRGNVTSA